MTAKELAEKLLEHPDYEVRVGIMQYLFGDSAYGYDNITESLIDVNENKKIIYLGE